MLIPYNSGMNLPHKIVCGVLRGTLQVRGVHTQLEVFDPGHSAPGPSFLWVSGEEESLAEGIGFPGKPEDLIGTVLRYALDRSYRKVVSVKIGTPFGVFNLISYLPSDSPLLEPLRALYKSYVQLTN